MKEGRTEKYSAYREAAVMPVRHHHTESAGISGRTIREGERVEVGVSLAPDTFRLPPATESGRGK